MTGCTKAETPTATAAPTPDPVTAVGLWQHKWTYTLSSGERQNPVFFLEIMPSGQARLRTDDRSRAWVNGRWYQRDKTVEVILEIEGSSAARRLSIEGQKLCIIDRGFLAEETGCYEKVEPGSVDLAAPTKNDDQPFWAISIGSGPNKEAAEKLLDGFYKLGLPTGVLWIPDYSSLSGRRSGSHMSGRYRTMIANKPASF